MVVLKGIPALLSPELLYALARMGHGDEIGAAPSPLPPPRRRWEGQWAWPNAPRLRGPTAAANGAGRSVLADVNFPTSSVCRCGPEEIRADGLGIPQLLEAVLTLLPLDTYVESPAAVMELVPSDRERGLQTPVWTSYQSILLQAGCRGDGPLRKPHPQEGGAGARRPVPGVLTVCPERRLDPGPDSATSRQVQRPEEPALPCLSAREPHPARGSGASGFADWAGVVPVYENKGQAQ
ncbi:fucose mutarotase isoform X1 [Phacochoerus africanus]|uniref:fucose mutarotase isoform X1 n=1 Tax=Phacochoerus africanus TaxID=41426 RepID=UPI001FDA7406|nr:fucose mutarotase isoform X1 [Phacochoerus africanus]